jgi:hypothetical protein
MTEVRNNTLEIPEHFINDTGENNRRKDRQTGKKVLTKI